MSVYFCVSSCFMMPLCNDVKMMRFMIPPSHPPLFVELLICLVETHLFLSVLFSLMAANLLVPYRHSLKDHVLMLDGSSGVVTSPHHLVFYHRFLSFFRSVLTLDACVDLPPIYAWNNVKGVSLRNGV